MQRGEQKAYPDCTVQSVGVPSNAEPQHGFAPTVHISNALSVHAGVALTQVPDALQVRPDGQEPHEPPQPSPPHSRAPHDGTHSHAPERQDWPVGHVPHEVPHTGSSPQTLVPQTGVQPPVYHP